MGQSTWGLLVTVHPTVNMKYFAVFSAVVSCSLGAPVAEAEADAQVLLAKPYINSGSASGPLTPLVGDLVATNRGYASLSLEGFSEDVNEDGFVDPIAHAAPVVSVAAPVAYHTIAAPAVKTVEVKAAVAPAATVPVAPVAYHVAAPVKTVEVKAAPAVAVAPAAYHVATAPVVHQVGYQVHHQVHHVPQVTVQKHTSTHTTHHVINHAPVVGAFIGAVPVAAAAEAAPAAEAAAVEEA